MLNELNESLIKYINDKIIPMYKKFDKGHDVNHVTSVINDSLKIAEILKDDVDMNIVYTIAAFHDTGLSKNRDVHHIESGKIVRKDTFLRTIFDKDTIELIAQACEDHRASSKHPPRSLYGKVVSDADRSDNLDTMFKRAYNFGKHNNPELSEEEHFERVYEHLSEKYGRKGYVKYHLKETEEVRKLELNKIYTMLDSRDKSYKYFLQLKDEGFITESSDFILTESQQAHLEGFYDVMDGNEFLNEAAQTITTSKRKKIEDMVLKTMNLLDKTGKNGEKYKGFFKSMSNTQFTTWIKKFMKDENEHFYLEIIPYENEPDLKTIKKAANFLNVPLEEYVYYKHDGNKDEPIRSKTKVPVGYLHLRRLQQILSKKNSYSLDIKSRNMKTNQVTGNDKIARITDAENYALMTYGSEEALKEFFGPRADDSKKKMQMYKQISQQGYLQLKDLKSDLGDKQTLNTVDVYFMGAGIMTDLVTGGLALDRTLKNKNKKDLSREKYEKK